MEVFFKDILRLFSSNKERSRYTSKFLFIKLEIVLSANSSCSNNHFSYLSLSKWSFWFADLNYLEDQGNAGNEEQDYV
jgi:hypothetical protein